LIKRVTLHIPHSSVKIPFTDGYIVDSKTLEKEILKLTDWFTDDLFCSEDDVTAKADFSRIFCDVERFADDSQEVMAQYGMGVLYEKNDDGETIRKVNSELREKVLNSYYWKHHEALSKAVNDQLQAFGKALIIDCHSFPSLPHKRDLDQNSNRPDFNIGTDPFHTTKELIDLSFNFFKKRGYAVGIDWPYSGSIVPLEHYRKNKNAQTIMLEVNRKLYLNEPTNEKSGNYDQIKRITSAFIRELKGSL
jgi:N-formylglutamate deformylase